MIFNQLYVNKSKYLGKIYLTKIFPNDRERGRERESDRENETKMRKKKMIVSYKQILSILGEKEIKVTRVIFTIHRHFLRSVEKKIPFQMNIKVRTKQKFLFLCLYIYILQNEKLTNSVTRFILISSIPFIFSSLNQYSNKNIILFLFLFFLNLQKKRYTIVSFFASHRSIRIPTATPTTK